MWPAPVSISLPGMCGMGHIPAVGLDIVRPVARAFSAEVCYRALPAMIGGLV